MLYQKIIFREAPTGSPIKKPQDKKPTLTEIPTSRDLKAKNEPNQRDRTDEADDWIDNAFAQNDVVIDMPEKLSHEQMKILMINLLNFSNLKEGKPDIEFKEKLSLLSKELQIITLKTITTVLTLVDKASVKDENGNFITFDTDHPAISSKRGQDLLIHLNRLTNVTDKKNSEILQKIMKNKEEWKTLYKNLIK